MIRIRFLPAAEQELLKQIAYYSQARDGTGIRFEAAVRMRLPWLLRIRAAERPRQKVRVVFS